MLNSLGHLQVLPLQSGQTRSLGEHESLLPLGVFALDKPQKGEELNGSFELQHVRGELLVGCFDKPVLFLLRVVDYFI